MKTPTEAELGGGTLESVLPFELHFSAKTIKIDTRREWLNLSWIILLHPRN